MAQVLKDEFIQFLSSHTQATTDAELRDHFKKKYDALPNVMNELMTAGRLKVFQQGNVLSYELVAVEEAEKMKGLNAEQRLVLQEISKAGNLGIWTRDIKTSTNLPQQAITKILRLLETRRLVKSVKSISSKNKKLYMLFDLVPSRELTGGPWYNEQEFDHEFIETLSTFVFEVIKAAGMASLKVLTDKVRASGISKVSLGPEEVMSIINVLMYDGRIEPVRAMANTKETNYKVSSVVSTFNTLSDVPCGVCPVFNECGEDNVISPHTCLYMTKWLELKELDF